MKTLLTFMMALLCQVSLSQSIWVGQVLSFDQGLNNNGESISPLRSNSSNCIGMAQSSDSFTPDTNANYVSLGFKGEMVVMMESAVKNVEGMDLKVHETTFGTPPCRRYPERIMLFASQDNCNWYFCGIGCQDSEFDLGELNWAQYFKLVDVSPYGNFDPFGVCDGYDVDGIEGYVLETEMSPSTLGVGTAQHIINFTQGLRKNGTPVISSRSNPSNALGLPQGTENVNFVSLGFGGQITLKFDYTVFNIDGFDFKITGTTYGNPQCPQYPEQALIEVSMDGFMWTTLGVYCLDAMIELGDVNCFQYIRITDRSRSSSFGPTADGYDVDGVFSFQNCGPQQRVDFDDIVTMNEESEVTLSPNPFDDEIIINNNEIKDVIVYNYVGMLVKQYSGVTNQIDVSELPKGVYYIEVLSNQSKTTHKLFKN